MTAKHPEIQAAIDASQAPTQDVNFSSAVYTRSDSTWQERAAAARRTLQMAEALLPAIENAYGKDSIEAADARIALNKAAEADMAAYHRECRESLAASRAA